MHPSAAFVEAAFLFIHQPIVIPGSLQISTK